MILYFIPRQIKHNTRSIEIERSRTEKKKLLYAYYRIFLYDNYFDITISE